MQVFADYANRSLEAKSTLFIISVSLFTLVAPGLWGVLGSAGFYISEMTKDPKSFSPTLFLMYCFLGFVIAMMVFYSGGSDDGVMGAVFQSPGFLIACGFSVRRVTEIVNRVLDIGLVKK